MKQLRRALVRRKLVATFIAAVVSAGAAQAGVFEVKGPEVSKGETEVSSNNAFFNGFPGNADRLRSGHELAIGYAFTSWFKAATKLNFDKPADNDFQLSTAGVEAQAVLQKFEGGFGLGWFTGVDLRVHRDETNAVTFGPIVQLGTEKTQLILNPFFVRTFGANREEGLDLAFGWAAKQQIREGFALGIEGYGVIPNLGNSPGTSFQEHRIGPVVYLERSLGGAKATGRSLSIKDTRGAGDDNGGGPKLAVEAGVLFGLTEATQDTTIRLKAAITF